MAKFQIKELAQARGLDLEGLQDCTGVHRRNLVGYWENSIVNFHGPTLDKIAKVLGVEVGVLFAGMPWPYHDRAALSTPQPLAQTPLRPTSQQPAPNRRASAQNKRSTTTPSQKPQREAPPPRTPLLPS